MADNAPNSDLAASVPAEAPLPKEDPASPAAESALSVMPAWEDDAPLPYVETWSETQLLPVECKPLTPEEADLLVQLKQASLSLVPTPRLRESNFVCLVRGYMHEKPENRLPSMIQHIEATCAWKAKVGADDILSLEIPGEREFARQWPTSFHGVSKRGYLIQIDEVARLDPEFMFSKLDPKTLELLNCKLMETAQHLKRERTRALGVLQYKQIVIIDLAGLGRKHIGSRAQKPIKDQIMIKQSHYPETLYRMYLVNVPMIFRAVWAIIKRFLDPMTQKRIVLLGSDISPMLDEIDMDQIPESVGGAGCGLGAQCWCKKTWKTRQEEFQAQREEERKRSGAVQSGSAGA